MTKKHVRKADSQESANRRPSQPPTSGPVVQSRPPARPGVTGRSRGRPAQAWNSWRRTVEAFAAERPVRQPELQTELLLQVLPASSSWAELVNGGWVLLAVSRADEQHFPGYGTARIHQVLERFTHWLHGRGDIDDWQRDVLCAAIDDAREAWGFARKGARAAREMLSCWLSYDRDLAAFVASLEPETHRPLAPRVIASLELAVERQLGPSRSLPMGAVDPEEYVADLFLMPELVLQSHPDVRDAFWIAAAFYRWAGDTARLDPQRAAHLAGRFSEAALRSGEPAPPGAMAS